MPNQQLGRFGKELGRAFGGSLLFALPLLMTMEMWWFGFYLDRFKIAIFVILLLPLLVGLSYYSGFRKTFDLREDVIDALVAFVVGAVMSAVILALFNVIWLPMPINDLLGKVILLAVPASIGAIVASKQLGEKEGNEQEQQTASYAGELVIMAAGGLLLAFNVAPTEEMILIAYKMTEWHAIALLLFTLVIMHAFVYTVGFRGQEVGPEQDGFWHVFSHFTVVGYAIALLISLYVLWTFDRLTGNGMSITIMSTVVLAFPAGLGAAVARLVV